MKRFQDLEDMEIQKSEQYVVILFSTTFIFRRNFLMILNSRREDLRHHDYRHLKRAEGEAGALFLEWRQ